MQSAADIAARMDRGLEALFEAGLELALQVQADAMAAETVDERARLALTFHRLSRSVRQTAALRMRLVREAERAAREVAADQGEQEASRDAERTRKRRDQVTAAVQSLIWSEAESEAGEADLRSDLEELLDIESQDAETFLAEPLDAQVARLARRLGLKPPAALPDGGAAPGASLDAWGEDLRRSSA